MSASPPPDQPVSSGHSGPGPTGRWLITGGLLLVALPVTGAFYFFAAIAAMGCFMDCSQADPRPLMSALLLLGAASMAGAWAGLVPWAMGRRDLIPRTIGAAACVVLVSFAWTALIG